MKKTVEDLKVGDWVRGIDQTCFTETEECGIVSKIRKECVFIFDVYQDSRRKIYKNNITHIGVNALEPKPQWQEIFRFGPNQQKWIRELKSGKYRQVHGHLCDRDSRRHYGYCCLGLACRIAHDKNPFAEKFDGNYKSIRIGGLTAVLPTGYKDLYGLKSIVGAPNRIKAERLYPDTTFHSLWKYNDCLNWSLKKIGEWLEKYPEIYFEKSA